MKREEAKSEKRTARESQIFCGLFAIDNVKFLSIVNKLITSLNMKIYWSGGGGLRSDTAWAR